LGSGQSDFVIAVAVVSEKHQGSESSINWCKLQMASIT